ncbi:MAG: hypothetical protein R6W75_06155 [Smithellaceae bacterium]
MKFVLIVIGALIAAFILMTVILYIRALMGSKRNAEALVKEILPVINALKEGARVPNEQIMGLAKRPETRGGLYQVLHEMGHADLFPSEYSNPSQLAESHLVVWLRHPNELGADPDEIELAADVVRNEGGPPQNRHYYVFKFRTKPPHWAAKDGWMAGVAGPYIDGEPLIYAPNLVFSQLEAFDSVTPEEHLAKIEKIIKGTN